MHIDEFRSYQEDGAKSHLFSLVTVCRRRFLRASQLLEVRSPTIEKLATVGVTSSVDVWPLLNPFLVLCDRYVENFFSPQKELLPTPQGKQDEKWSKYFHHVLMPMLVSDDEIVRNVLRSIRALPCKSPEAAVAALVQRFSEMTLPETEPPWAPEDIYE